MRLDDYSEDEPQASRNHHRRVSYNGDSIHITEYRSQDTGERFFQVMTTDGAIDFTVEEWAELKKFFNDRRAGPQSFVQDEVRELLEKAFAQKDTWPVNTIIDRLYELGYRNKVTIDKARKDLNIITRPVFSPGERGIQQWVWSIDRSIEPIDANR